MTVLKNVTNAYMDEVVYAEKDRQVHTAGRGGKDLHRRPTPSSIAQRENFKADAEKAGIAVGGNDP